ncbi:tyrosine-type recombinase/integrase [Aurantiacibacter suaedae]|uniref:tyrosine-type recombinase/integrase n=1 Tax=Aurantiacibacter suaedae TaxID=2545755 RepID=UPI0010F5556A|nr:integrase arm-type DNA-binding domain-containing protein [Aurantiacibacter suaedae]
MLTVTECKNAKPGERPVKLFDGGGLHLLVLPSGVKSWRLKYRFGGKEKQLTFGQFPEVPLAEARDCRDSARKELRDGVDPGARIRQIRARRTSPNAGAYTFKQAALRWHELQSHGWKPHHATQVRHALEAEAFPSIGERALADLLPADIRPIVETMQNRGAVDQAHRMLQRISRIFQLAIVDGKTSTDPAASLSAILRPITKRKYPAILSLKQAAAALKAFEAEPHWPATKLASRLLALTASRPGPVRFAQAAEFHDLDGEEPIWIIPAAKLKLERAESEQANFAFTIPLSCQAVETVKAALALSAGRKWLFPSAHRALLPLSENGLSVAYRRSPLFSGHHVPHGWRSTFSTVMNERAAELDRPGDRAIIDLMLAHKPQGVESRYNRAAYMPRRRQLAQEWADLLSANLVPAIELLEGPRH